MISDIIKESLALLKSEHKNITPDNYMDAFCLIARKKGVIVEDCQKLQKYINKLDPKLSKEIKKYNVKNLDELFAFLNSQIVRCDPSKSSELIEAFTALTNRLLQTITLLHNKTAKDLANTSLDKIKYLHDKRSVEIIKEKWFDFLTNYDDSFLKRLDVYCKISTDDLKEMIDDIIKCLKKEEDKEIFKSLAPLIIAALAPSIALSMDDELAALSYELRSSPEILGSTAVLDDIKNLIKKRIELDKKEIKNKISLLDGLLEEISAKVLDMIEKSDLSGKQIAGIKEQLQRIDFSKDSFELIQQKLITLAGMLESETDSLTQKMQDNQETIKKLRLKINHLENALHKAKKESKIDYLTTLLNKRALEFELSKAEENFVRHQINYSICFFDIDHFKMINDTYGHEAGDIILRAVAKILKKYTREVDVIGRYGGEEFLIVLPSTDLKNAVYFANKIKDIVYGYKFLYKDERISVALSGGVAERKMQKTMQETIEKADSMLYKAKDSGRNRVFPMGD
jgi:diguanylate cyclase (GGDEF)-like protein